MEPSGATTVRPASLFTVPRLALVSEGYSNRAIATHLVMAERTVEAHMSAIFAKLGLEVSRDQHRRVLAVLTLLRA